MNALRLRREHCGSHHRRHCPPDRRPRGHFQHTHQQPPAIRPRPGSAVRWQHPFFLDSHRASLGEPPFVVSVLSGYCKWACRSRASSCQNKQHDTRQKPVRQPCPSLAAQCRRAVPYPLGRFGVTSNVAHAYNNRRARHRSGLFAAQKPGQVPKLTAQLRPCPRLLS